MFCKHCGEDDGDNLFHKETCDGQQGQVEAQEPRAPYVPHENVRGTDPDTSRAAAESLDVTVVQQRVYEIHLEYPAGLTDEELLSAYIKRFGVTAESSPRKRRCDLTKIGLIVDSGERRALKSTRQGIVWKLAAQAPTADTYVTVHHKGAA